MTPVIKHPATPRPGVESTVTVEPVPKTESAVLEQLKEKREAVVLADPPKPKEEGAPVEQHKAKAETTLQQHTSKAEAKAVEKTDQPKPEGQSTPLLSFAGIKGAFGFGPSKPEKPPPVSHDVSTQLEEDEEADVQAAIQESLKAPTSPQVQSGAQSSTLMPTDLDQKESDLMTQLDKLSAESLRLEAITNPSIRDKSRIRTIEGVTEDIVKQLEEITQQRLRSSPPAVSSQSGKVQPATPIAAPPVSKPEAPSASVKAVSPHKRKPLTIEGLIQGMSGQQDPRTVASGALQLAPQDTGVQQPTTLSVRDPEPPRVRSRERTPVRQSRAATPPKEVQPALPAIEDGTPPRKELEQELPRERERTPPREHSRERRRERRSPSTSRDRSPEKRLSCTLSVWLGGSCRSDSPIGLVFSHDFLLPRGLWQDLAFNQRSLARPGFQSEVSGKTWLSIRGLWQDLAINHRQGFFYIYSCGNLTRPKKLGVCRTSAVLSCIHYKA